jgi:hypothetical protein
MRNFIPPAPGSELAFAFHFLLAYKYLYLGQLAVEMQRIDACLQDRLPGSPFASLPTSHFPSTKQELAVPQPIPHHRVTSPNIPLNGMVAPSERKRVIA